MMAVGRVGRTAVGRSRMAASVQGNAVARIEAPVARPRKQLSAQKAGEKCSQIGLDWMHDGSKGFFEHQPGFLFARARC